MPRVNFPKVSLLQNVAQEQALLSDRRGLRLPRVAGPAMTALSAYAVKVAWEFILPPSPGK